MIMRNLKCYITEYIILNKRYAGINLLAFSFEEAQQKIDIHNKYTSFKHILIGELIHEE